MKKKDKNTTGAESETVQESTAEQSTAEQSATEQSAAEQTTAEQSTEAAQQQEFSVEQWQAALETAVKQRDEYLDSLRRSQADFLNFKRRNQTARSDGYEDGMREVIAAILPSIDNLERALDAAEKAGESGPMMDGVKMTLTSLTEGLKRFGFEEVPALGEQFDPELHNAVMREAGETPGKILDVFQKGYRVKGKIIRYAMVKVCAE